MQIATIEERFGNEIAEAFQLWMALREDLDKTVRNLGAEPLEVENMPNQSDAETEQLEEGRLEGLKTNITRDDEAGEGGKACKEPEMTQLDGLDTCVGGPLVHGGDAEPAGECERPPEGNAGPAGECKLLPEGDDQGREERRHEGDAHMEPNMGMEAAIDACGGTDDAAGDTQGEVGPSGGEHSSNVVPGQVWSEDPNDPYYVPVAWHGVLAAWNREAREVADSGLSVGNFEHSLEHPEEHGTDNSQVEASAATASGAGAVAGAPVLSSGSSTTATADGGSGTGSGSLKGGQTDLRGWLRK